MLAGQIEVESLWKVDAQLRTSRERGTGLSQATIAYNADGTVRFNTIAELKQAHKAELANWTEATLFDPRLNMRALILKDRTEYLLAQGAATDRDRTAFMFAAYNSGRGLVRKDRLLCANTQGCDSRKWFGHTEKQGYQSKAKWKGYGASPFEITRAYIPDVMDVRAPKYEKAMRGMRGS